MQLFLIETTIFFCHVRLLKFLLSFLIHLGLHHSIQVLNLEAMDNSRHWKIVGCSAFTGEGLLEGFDWLVQDIASRIYMLD